MRHFGHHVGHGCKHFKWINRLLCQEVLLHTTQLPTFFPVKRISRKQVIISESGNLRVLFSHMMHGLYISPYSSGHSDLLGHSIFFEPLCYFPRHENIVGNHDVPIHIFLSLSCPCIPLALELAVHKQ